MMARIALYAFITLLIVMAAARGQLHHDHATMPEWLLSHPDFSFCCSNRDCGRLLTPPRPTSAGWLVYADGRWFPPVPYQHTRHSRDENFWACIIPGQAEVRCLFVPPSGV